MNAITEPLSPVGVSNARRARGGERTRVRGAARAALREVSRNWLGPLLIAAALATVHQLGVFSLIDGRFFDFATVNEPGKAPQVVLVESGAMGSDVKAGQINSSLARLGVERIGYLSSFPKTPTEASVPVIVAEPARPSRASGLWQLPPNSSSTSAARALAPADYGINRRQLTQISTRSGTYPVFDIAVAGNTTAGEEFYVPMSRRQNIPVLKAGQILRGELRDTELQGTVAIVAEPDAFIGTLTTPLTPDRQGTSEALFRAHAVQALRSGTAVYAARIWEAWVLVITIGAILAIAYRRADPKRLAVIFPFAVSVLIAAGCWAALQFSGKLLPITALLMAPWLITFQRVLGREASQDRRLEQSASRAVQMSFRRSPLREGARLPEFLGTAARYAGVERSLLVERKSSGTLEAVAAENASLDDIVLGRKELSKILDSVRRSKSVRDADDIVPGWEGEARIGWVGGGDEQLFWLHTRPETSTPGKSAHLVRALVSSFRELFRWRTNLHSRSREDERFLPVDEKVASAIALVANESEQIRRGFDTIDTAVVIFHLIGSPLHANQMMQDLYREAGLSLYDTSLPEMLQNLTGFERPRVDALIEDLMLNGGEMRLPMRDLGTNERVLRLAAPARNARGGDRIIVLEAVDIADLNRAADLRQAVAQFIDLQLRNDFEAILLGSELAKNKALSDDKVRGVVARIGETARRATNRLDEVAELVRAENRDLIETCYPIDASKAVAEAITSVTGMADELGVTIEQSLPGVSGFTIAEPNALVEMLVAMLRVVIADTPQNGTVTLDLEEAQDRTHIRVSGGFGIGFGRLMWLMSNPEDDAVGEFRVIGAGMTKAVGWAASVSYWGREADGFGFNIDMKRIG